MPDNKTRITKKTKQLVAEHGERIQELVAQGNIPYGQIENFYGRHPERRKAILSAMKAGSSYSKAYDQSRGTFDTKNWGKIPNRTAACRGHLLKTAACLATQGRSDFDPPEKRQLVQIVHELGTEAKELVRRILLYELAPAEKKSNKRKSSEPCDLSNCQTTFKRIHGQLAVALTKLEKNCRDVPKMWEMLGTLPSVPIAAHVAVECGRIISGTSLFVAALEVNPQIGRRINNSKDKWGIGTECAPWLVKTLDGPAVPRRIATHRQPDADALVAAWLADRFLFPDEQCKIEFVPRNFVPAKDNPYDCIVDVGRAHEPASLIFDHKPPAFEHRDQECATSLVWRHACKLHRPVKHMKELVVTVHDGDAATRRQKSNSYAESRQTGLHALINCARERSQNDQMLYQAVTLCLDSLTRNEKRTV